MSEKLKLIVLDPQSRTKLEELGRLEGSPIIETEDLSSPKSKEIIASLPVLRDATCGLDNPSARNLELLRQFSQNAHPKTTLWASARIDDSGQIQSIGAPANVELAQGLINNPSRIVSEISKAIDTHITKLPREWSDPTLSGETVAVHFTEIVVDLSEIGRPDMAAEKVGPKLSHFLFDVILVLKMLGTARMGKGVERRNARHFLSDLTKIGIPYLRTMSKHTHTSPNNSQLSMAAQHGLYTFFVLAEQANNVLKTSPLDFAFPLPKDIASAAK